MFLSGIGVSKIFHAYTIDQMGVSVKQYTKGVSWLARPVNGYQGVITKVLQFGGHLENTKVKKSTQPTNLSLGLCHLQAAYIDYVLLYLILAGYDKRMIYFRWTTTILVWVRQLECIE